MYLLMTRPRAASERFVAQLSQPVQEVIEPVYSPLLDIRLVGEDVDVGDTRGLIFTSSNGVAAAARIMTARNLPCFCVGQATTVAARRQGWSASMAGESAEALIAGLLRQRPDGPLLHLRGQSGVGDVAQTLTQLGLTTRERVVYCQDLLPLTDEAVSALGGSAPVIAPIFSPRTARQFADLVQPVAPLLLAAMSDAVAKPLISLTAQAVRVAKRPDSDAMVTAVEKLVKQALRVEGGPDAH
ncbi:uroporphyrinogen-III synthase [Falsiruegeria litorea R37]|uniref:Uroporphyrinogen-III synthase n=1 Tax=Falsiruegeria litorea R37 TaxID=1200284 RepID=A0A1Y5TPM2_9RHOB|nr:uroporphyrinogen-III synthase [Falsiruegeria litorea]SLN69023.1 uroporphyrinogen-III synthase [Falsiruegeria litorea R37]